MNVIKKKFFLAGYFLSSLPYKSTSRMRIAHLKTLQSDQNQLRHFC